METARKPLYQRRGIELGAGAILTGALLLILALVPFRSSAAKPPSDVVTKVTICHRTNSVTNPYTVETVSINAADGSLGNGNNDHTHHIGPVFDPNVDYPPPHNGDQWGDIIPAYQWGPNAEDTFPGLNWPAGQSVLGANCAVPTPSTTTTTTPPGSTTTTAAPPGSTTTTTTVAPPGSTTTPVPSSAVVLPTSIEHVAPPTSAGETTTTGATVEGTQVVSSEGTNALAVTGAGDAIIVFIGALLVALGVVLMLGGIRHRSAS